MKQVIVLGGFVGLRIRISSDRGGGGLGPLRNVSLGLASGGRTELSESESKRGMAKRAV